MAAGIFGVTFGQIAIVPRLHFAPGIFLDIGPAQNPFAPQSREALAHFAGLILITPRAARIVNRHRFIGFNAPIESFRRAESNLAQWHLQVGVDFARHVDLRGVGKPVTAPRMD